MGPATKQLLTLIRRYDSHAAVVSDGREIVCICPFCKGVRGHKQKLWANPVKKLYICYKCNARGTTPRLITELKRKFPAKFIGVDVNLNDIIEQEPTFEAASVVLPADFLPLWGQVRSTIGQQALTYLSSRGIDGDLVELYRLHYAMVGKFAYRIIIPTYENGKLVYYIGRDFTGKLEKKVLNPSKEEIGGVGSHAYVFGLDLAKKFDEAVVTEGVFDAMSVRPPIGPIGTGVALFGKTMSNLQFEKLCRSGLSRVTLMLDHDARKSLFNLAKGFLKTRTAPKVRVALLPSGDPSSMRARLNEVNLIENVDESSLSKLKLLQ